MHGVYKYEVKGEVIYVGKTNSDFETRIACHKRERLFAPYLSSAKIFVRELKDAKEADFMETLLINQYKPKLNKVKKDVTDIEICASIDWIPWSEYNRRAKESKRNRIKKRACVFYLSVDNLNKLESAAKKAGISKSAYLDQLMSKLL